MKTLIVYASKHGCTEKCALKLKEKLVKEATLLNLKQPAQVDLNEYSTIIIGGSIYAGQIQKPVRQFCEANFAKLLEKKLGLFLCCMEVDKAQQQFEEAFASELRNHAIATGLFGGEFNLEDMNFIEKFLVKKLAHVEKSVSQISEESISNFITQLA